jgi:hypothetical protein
MPKDIHITPTSVQHNPGTPDMVHFFGYVRQGPKSVLERGTYAHVSADKLILALHLLALGAPKDLRNALTKYDIGFGYGQSNVIDFIHAFRDEGRPR